MISLDRYGALLKRKEIRDTLFVSLLGRLPIGITGLAVLLLVQQHTGSFVVAGIASGCYVIGLAASAPFLGRAIDRWGPRPALVVCAVAFPSALGGLVLAVNVGGAPVFLLSAIAGAAFPPITVCMRTFLRRRLQEDALLTAAYSIESVLIELIFIVGPVLVALFVWGASPALAVAFAALCGATGTALFLRSPAVRSWVVEPTFRRSLLGPMSQVSFAILIAIVLAYSTAFGLLEIGITAYATRLGQPALAGIFLGLMSVGSALGGLAYGSRSWHLPLRAQFATTLALMGGGLALLALNWTTPILFALLAILAGIVMAPALIIQAMLVAKTARTEHSTEAFTWSTSALLCGVGLGLAAGGLLLEYFEVRSAFAVGALAAFGAALGTRLLERP